MQIPGKLQQRHQTMEEFPIDMMDKPSQSWEIGVIHGRFQVLHNDHLKYLLAGNRLCRHLVVGITNPDPCLTKEDKTDPGRSDLPANPLTYFERYLMVRSALKEQGISLERFFGGTFTYQLSGAVQVLCSYGCRVFFLRYTTIGGRRKRSLFESLGMKTHVLWEVAPEKKGISGRELRLRISDGRPWSIWFHQVWPNS